MAVECPAGDFAGSTSREVLEHLVEHHHGGYAAAFNQADRVSVAKIANRLRAEGDGATATVVEEVAAELVLDEERAARAPIETPAGALVPGEVATVRIGGTPATGTATTLRGYTVGRAPVSEYSDLVLTGPGGNRRSVHPKMVTAIERPAEVAR